MTDQPWTVLRLLRWTTDHFASKGIETARLDAELLLAHALGVERLRLYLDFEKPVMEEERARFRMLVRQRGGERVPVAYLTGMREFWSLPLAVTPDVLIPRPDTETLVEAVLSRGSRERPLRVLDLGTGSGAIALALAKEWPEAEVTASDVSDAAIAVAQKNAEALGLAERVRFAAGDGFEAVPGARFDVIVSNPPYVPEADAGTLAPELAHEPPGALFAPGDGTALLRRIAAEAPEHLAPGGLLALELAPAQAEGVTQSLEAAGFEGLAAHRDLTGRVRALSALRPGGE
ncbi:MAG: peptide chain release factor N(5)-glutamine methyltransferase [Myxococcota bacterium]